MNAIAGLRGKLIVSCQAWEDDPFHGAGRMALFARAAVAGGAAGIRANGPEDVREIKAATGVPVIAIQKRMAADGRILITPTFEDAAALAAAGADAVALDCTARGQRSGALERLARMRAELGVAAAADIATIEEARAAEAAGADYVLSTMRGYTEETAHITGFDARFVADLVGAVRVPVIAEGRIASVEDVRAAMDAGAFAVVVGSAITRPRDLTARFAGALRAYGTQVCFLGIDLGGTNVKSGLVRADGTVVAAQAEPTRTGGGRDAVLAQLGRTAARLRAEAERLGLEPLAAGVACAGWPDRAGVIVYGTANLPEWTGARVADAVAPHAGVPVFVENDANAAAAAEHAYGAARGVGTFLCVTIGTGIGCGCFAEGRLLRGGRFLGGQLGHIVVEPGGRECSCGGRGCLEQYANLTALESYSGPKYVSAREIITAAAAGDPEARAAVEQMGHYLSRGLMPAVRLLDPEVIVLAGGGALQNGHLAACVHVGEPRIRVKLSQLAYYSGVSGATAIAKMRLNG